MPRRRSRRSTFTPALVGVVLILLGAIALERAGKLPEGLAGLVREIEVSVLDPLLAELGFAVPEDNGADRSRTPPVVRREVDLARVRTLLAQIAVKPERRAGYDRQQWPHWLDIDGDCIDTRDEVLAAESLEPVHFGRDGCQVIAGRWLDPYTGETILDPSQLDVDHFVPLQEAHESGGNLWDRRRRTGFANDLRDPRSLIAVTAAANRAKGASGPDEWLPPQRSYRCRYVVDWIEVKARWGLAMDERERSAVGDLLDACKPGAP